MKKNPQTNTTTKTKEIGDKFNRTGRCDNYTHFISLQINLVEFITSQES